MSDTPTMDGQVLLAHILDRPRTWVIAHPEVIISSDHYKCLEDALTRLEDNEPLPYILGHWEFFGIDFLVTRHTLIPRPETELLVERALAWLKQNPTRRLAVDVGTGSGAVAVALAARVSNLKILASDISLPALQVARQNICRHRLLDRVSPVQANLIPATSMPFDLICANLPYISTETLHNLDVFLWEPELALDGGIKGLDIITRLLADLSKDPTKLSAGGLLLMEIDVSQGLSMDSLVKQFIPQAQAQVFCDLAGRERLVAIQMNDNL
jgi:release factor glutamine methyltransferase